MSRSGYTEDDDNWSYIMWRGAVKKAIHGARGQKFLRELIACLDAMPKKELIANNLVSDGGYCALGVVGLSRGLPMTEIDPEDPQSVSEAFDIAGALAKEVVFVNDEAGYFNELPSTRWKRVRQWAAKNLELTR